MTELETKMHRLGEFLDRHELEGVMLQLRNNFAWITGGRDNHIANNTPLGVAAILVTRFVAGVSPDIPWHVTAFHKDYKMTDPENTSVATLMRAAEIGTAAGLRFVYAGNIPGRVGRWENTYCPGCSALLIERVGYRIVQNRLAKGACPDCGRAIPGFWDVPA